MKVNIEVKMFLADGHIRFLNFGGKRLFLEQYLIYMIFQSKKKIISQLWLVGGVYYTTKICLKYIKEALEMPWLKIVITTCHMKNK